MPRTLPLATHLTATLILSLFLALQPAWAAPGCENPLGNQAQAAADDTAQATLSLEESNRTFLGLKDVLRIFRGIVIVDYETKDGLVSSFRSVPSREATHRSLDPFPFAYPPVTKRWFFWNRTISNPKPYSAAQKESAYRAFVAAVGNWHATGRKDTEELVNRASANLEAQGVPHKAFRHKTTGRWTIEFLPHQSTEHPFVQKINELWQLSNTKVFYDISEVDASESVSASLRSGSTLNAHEIYAGTETILNPSLENLTFSHELNHWLTRYRLIKGESVLFAGSVNLEGNDHAPAENIPFRDIPGINDTIRSYKTYFSFEELFTFYEDALADDQILASASQSRGSLHPIAGQVIDAAGEFSAGHSITAYRMSRQTDLILKALLEQLAEHPASVTISMQQLSQGDQKGTVDAVYNFKIGGQSLELRIPLPGYANLEQTRTDAINILDVASTRLQALRLGAQERREFFRQRIIRLRPNYEAFLPTQGS